MGMVFIIIVKPVPIPIQVATPDQSEAMLVFSSLT